MNQPNFPIQAQNQADELSQSLRVLLRGTSQQDFFERIWQKETKVYRFSPEIVNDSAGQGGDGLWNEKLMQHSPLEELVQQRWHILRTLLQHVEGKHASLLEPSQGGRTPPEEHEIPLIFQDHEVQQRELIEELYGNSLFAPYLNGCSIVFNHGDLLSPWIAALCQDLQKSFPHAYANCYLTPPNSQAVLPHADDRDVLVFQLVGSKNWRVYQNVPVPLPYPHEQVGKEGRPVPKEVLEGPLDLSTTLLPGDVLYMPRGFVHEARCSDSLSFHITVALATHDWNLAGIMTTATRDILTQSIDLRKSILPTTSSTEVNILQQQINAAIRIIQEQVTAQTIIDSLKTRLDQHNQRASPLRMKLINAARFPAKMASENGQSPSVGPAAANLVSFETLIRAATPEERSQVSTVTAKPRGLHVREANADDILGIVSKLKSDLSIKCRVLDMRRLMPIKNSGVCDFSLLCLAKRAVELGAFAIADAS